MLTWFFSFSVFRLSQTDSNMKATILISTPLMIALVTLVGAKPSAGSCPPVPLNRPTEWLHQEWSQQLSMESEHDSSFMLPSFRDYLETNNLLTATGEEFPIEGNRTCPDQPSSEPGLEKRSMCPWYYIHNIDEDRFPAILTEARCKCPNKCLANPTLPCDPINYNILVLRKNTAVCDGDYYTYDVGYQPIAVGCTCAISSSA